MAPSGTQEIDLEFDPFSAEMMEEPYPTYKRLREHAPVYFNKKRNFWAITKYDDTRKVLKGYEYFSSKDGVELDGTGAEFFGESNLLLVDPPRHTKLRKVLHPHFTPQAIRKFDGSVAALAEELVDRLPDSGEVDLAKDYGWQLPIEAISMILGVPTEDRKWVAERVLRAFKREPGEDGIPEVALGAATDVREYFAAMAPERVKGPADDLVTVVATSQNLYDEQTTPEEVGSMCILLFAAGIITTGSFLSTSLYLAAKDESLRRRLASDAEILPKAVEELWRYETPVQHTARTCIKDYELGGELIKEGERVAIFEGSANRDEDIWEDGETLDIDRDFSRNMVFGDGVHVCLGAHLARLEGRIGLQALLKRIPDYEIAGPIEWTDRVNERGIVSLPVRY